MLLMYEISKPINLRVLSVPGMAIQDVIIDLILHTMICGAVSFLVVLHNYILICKFYYPHQSFHVNYH